MNATIYGISIVIILILFDVISWFYYWLYKFTQGKRTKLLGLGFFKGYSIIIFGCSAIIIISIFSDITHQSGLIYNVINSIIGLTIISISLYIFFVRSKIIAIALSE